MLMRQHSCKYARFSVKLIFICSPHISEPLTCFFILLHHQVKCSYFLYWADISSDIASLLRYENMCPFFNQ